MCFQQFAVTSDQFVGPQLLFFRTVNQSATKVLQLVWFIIDCALLRILIVVRQGRDLIQVKTIVIA